jgi:hypothetical protein
LPATGWLLLSRSFICDWRRKRRLAIRCSAFPSSAADSLDPLDPLDFPHVHTDQALHLAQERMSTARLDIIPVVNRADVHRLEGIVTLRDVLDSYGVDSSGSA